MSLEAAQRQSSARVAALDIWFGRVDLMPLAGGITNQNFKVQDRGKRYVVRVGSDIPVHGVVRANELAASRAALADISEKLARADMAAFETQGRFIQSRYGETEALPVPERTDDGTR